ncbi:pentapeptide repeat-containing protein [Phormidium sp. FACHB-592]|uniref:pentapeptide repeat-containing protein n=1 Tax=Phormidium sp. FACHB-592 TaxID=2692850 RepID=UPI001F55A263|nr:pentapeptide repeat-containing protein [Phormidium sp. FACHB-592]
MIRNKSPLPKNWKKDSKQQLAGVATDVQTAWTIIGRREVRHEREGEMLSLQKPNLSGATLLLANLEGAKLFDAKLEGAVLEGADLEGARFRGARLLGTKGMKTKQIKEADNWQGARYSPAFRQQLGLPPEKP